MNFLEINETVYRGIDKNQVIDQLKREHPEMNVYAISIGSAVTMDIRQDRLRVWYDDKDDLVVSVKQG